MCLINIKIIYVLTKLREFISKTCVLCDRQKHVRTRNEFIETKIKAHNFFLVSPKKRKKGEKILFCFHSRQEEKDIFFFDLEK